MNMVKTVASFIQIRRPVHYVGSVVPIGVSLDGGRVGSLMVGQSLRLKVEPGNHELRFTGGFRHSTTISVHVPPADQVSLVCSWGQLSLVKWRINVWPDQTHSGRQRESEPRLLGVVETDRMEEPIGDETRIIDNLRSGSAVTRTITASKEWVRIRKVNIEQTRTRGAAATMGSSLASLKVSADEVLRDGYSVESQTRQVYTEEISITVPPATLVRLTLHWMRLWQRGLVRFAEESDAIVEVPFQIAIGLTFDQSQAEERVSPSS